MADQLYLLALGSNRRHHRHGSPRDVIAAAIAELGGSMEIAALSETIESPAMGPSRRRYANAVAIVRGPLDPPAMLALAQHIEGAFGRRRYRRWGERVIDIDIILWSGGIWASPALSIPHREFRKRAFVLNPACSIAAGWRDPLTGLSIAQLAFRLHRGRSAA